MVMKKSILPFSQSNVDSLLYILSDTTAQTVVNSHKIKLERALRRPREMENRPNTPIQLATGKPQFPLRSTAYLMKANSVLNRP